MTLAPCTQGSGGWCLFIEAPWPILSMACSGRSSSPVDPKQVEAYLQPDYDSKKIAAATFGLQNPSASPNYSACYIYIYVYIEDNTYHIL